MHGASRLTLGLAFAAGMSACAGAAARTGTGSAAADDGASAGRNGFVREIAPFPVLDEHGRPYAHPFLGGLNVPRPQLVDIDADGDLDLFVQEHSNALWHFENTGTATMPTFVWRTDRFHGLDIAEWSRFVDIDADGDLDVMAERPYSYVRLFRNTGTPAAPAFTADADSLRDAVGRPIFADRQNIPALVDLDCNERLDLFLGRVDGTIARHEATEPGSARFAFITERFEGIEIIGQIDSVGSRHGANTMAFADHDRDGDVDLYWGDYFERGVLLMENAGRSCALFNLGTPPRHVPTADSLLTSGFNVPLLADIDGDGDLDFFMGVLGGAFNPIRTAANNFYFWERIEGGRLTLRTTRFLSGIDAGSESVPAIADLDADGDLDLLLGSKIDPTDGSRARLQLYRNDGTPSAPTFRLADTIDVADAYHQAPALADLDGDGDLDLLVGTWNQDVLYFRNDGSAREPRFIRDTARTIRPPRASNATPALGDLDGDGDLDLLIGESSGEINFLRNVGTRADARFELVTERYGDIDTGRRSAPTLVDFDGDGVLDLVVGGEEGMSAYRSAGTRAEPRFESVEWALDLPPMATPVLADIDGDGRLEVFSGGLGGGVVFFRWGRLGSEP